MLQRNAKALVLRQWRRNGRAAASLLALACFGFALKRFGWKWTMLTCAFGFTLFFERQRRVERAQFETWRTRIRTQQRRNNESLVMLVRDVTGRVYPVSQNHLQLMLRDGDFTGEDYEMLLRLDDDPSVNARPSVAASDVVIANLATHEVTEKTLAVCLSGTTSCCICLDTLNVGQFAKSMPCTHSFHSDCLDEWLRRKASCPLCQLKLE